MQNLFPTIIPVAIGLVALIAILIIIRHVSSKNRIESVRSDAIKWEKHNCPMCDFTMQPGYVLAGKGIIWRKNTESKPGTFTTIGSALENTLSFNLTPALNLAWHCGSCRLVLIDHSRMLKLTDK